jgi:hypothetical protein
MEMEQQQTVQSEMSSSKFLKTKIKKLRISLQAQSDMRQRGISIDQIHRAERIGGEKRYDIETFKKQFANIGVIIKDGMNNYYVQMETRRFPLAKKKLLPYHDSLESVVNSQVLVRIIERKLIKCIIKDDFDKCIKTNCPKILYSRYMQLQLLMNPTCSEVLSVQFTDEKKCKTDIYLEDDISAAINNFTTSYTVRNDNIISSVSKLQTDSDNIDNGNFCKTNNNKESKKSKIRLKRNMKLLIKNLDKLWT